MDSEPTLALPPINDLLNPKNKEITYQMIRTHFRTSEECDGFSVSVTLLRARQEVSLVHIAQPSYVPSSKIDIILATNSSDRHNDASKRFTIPSGYSSQNFTIKRTKSDWKVTFFPVTMVRTRASLPMIPTPQATAAAGLTTEIECTQTPERSEIQQAADENIDRKPHTLRASGSKTSKRMRGRGSRGSKAFRGSRGSRLQPEDRKESKEPQPWEHKVNWNHPRPGQFVWVNH